MLTLPEKDRTKYALLHTALLVIAIPIGVLAMYALESIGIIAPHPIGKRLAIFYSLVIWCVIGAFPYYPKPNEPSLLVAFLKPIMIVYVFLFPYLYITNIVLAVRGTHRRRKEVTVDQKDMAEHDS